MTLADALHALAVAGCRLAAAPDGGMTLDVPPGATIDREVLDVLAANRETVAAAIQPPPPAPAVDLAEYLAGKGLAPASASLVLHAVETFGVKAHAVTIEAPADDDADPVFFEPGVPCLTTVDTRWHEPRLGYVTIPAGTFGLVMPQPWAMADDFERRGVEALLAAMEKRKADPHVVAWIQGRARVIETAFLDFANVTAPDGTDLLPWRSPKPLETCAP